MMGPKKKQMKKEKRVGLQIGPEGEPTPVNRQGNRRRLVTSTTQKSRGKKKELIGKCGKEENRRGTLQDKRGENGTERCGGGKEQK